MMGVHATSAAWSEGEPWREAVLEYLDGNRRFLKEYLAEHLPWIEHRTPEATFLAWLDCSALELPTSPSRFFLDVAGVGLNDGSEFGEAGDGCVRLNIATSRGILEQILDRMRDAIEHAR
jgi:cystathionine beta-lyase